MDISINTAQNVDIHYKSAGLVLRIGAIMIDFAILGGIIIVVLMTTGLLDAWDYFSLPLALVFIILSLYHLLCELFLNGRSIGKLTLKLRVVRLDGRRLTLWDCLLRWSLRLVDITASMGVVAMISIIVSPKMQRLGDLAAGTIVILEGPGTSLQQLDYYDTTGDYEVVFPQAMLLTDKDVSIIKDVLREVEKTQEFKLLQPLVVKIKQLTGIETPLNNLLFIQTIVKDYVHLSKANE